MLNLDVQKAAQAAGVLLRHERRKMEYLRLLKLLYIADRESIKETGEPITLSHSVAMDDGPLSSDIYDLIKNVVESADWAKMIRRHGNSVRLLGDPGRSSLSKYELEKLDEVSRRYAHMTTSEIVRETHKFEEWIKNEPIKGSSRPIPIGDIIDAVGLGKHKNDIVRELREKAAVQRFFEEAKQ